VAEAVRLGNLLELRRGEHRPYIESRGIKFNITPDRRTPTYSDNSDSHQLNIREMWSTDFWHEFLDEMARQRYNVLSLWNLHPFPSIVKVPEYPDIALNDLWGQKDGAMSNRPPPCATSKRRWSTGRSMPRSLRVSTRRKCSVASARWTFSAGSPMCRRTSH
jgi:hypothetical protein